MRKFQILFFIFCFFQISINAIGPSDSILNIMFYNLENLFDPENDSITNDEDFTPKGKLNWTYGKLMKKLDNTAKVIIAAGKWNPPIIVGFCEVENKRVMEMLVRRESIDKYNYQVIHFDSPDQRGIDVAAIYREDQVRVLSKSLIPIDFQFAPDRKTRSILHFKALIKSTNDSIHVFVNHWPSKRGGALESDTFRVIAASILKDTVHQIFENDSNSKILIMGDLNDEYDANSTRYLIGNCFSEINFKNNCLYNLSEPLARKGEGTHFFSGHWSIIDHIIVSGNMLNPSKGLVINRSGFKIVKENFLFTKDKNDQLVPFRTYVGPMYKGGFSDHLPVMVEMKIIK